MRRPRHAGCCLQSGRFFGRDVIDIAAASLRLGACLAGF